MRAVLAGVFPLLTVAASPAGGRGAPAFEVPPTFKASAILPADLLRGPSHRVDEAVVNDGYTNRYRIVSDFGTFDALGRAMLETRVREIAALAQLKEISKAGVFAKALAESVKKPIAGAVAVAKDPVDTAKGVPGGVKRLFVNIGRQVKEGARAVKKEVDKKDEPEGGKKAEDEKSTGRKAADLGGSAARSLLGVSSSYRRWAEKLGVDPYTSNEPLRRELETVARVDAAGGIAQSLVVPLPNPVRRADNVNELVWGKDPEELQKLNEKRLEEMGVDKKLRLALFDNEWYSPSHQTRLIAALYDLEGTADRAAYVRLATQAESEDEALFYQGSAEMLERLRRQGRKLERILPDPQLAVAGTARGGLAVALPLDYVAWTLDLAATERELVERARKVGASGPRDLWVSGRVSPRTRRELEGRRWTVHELGGR